MANVASALETAQTLLERTRGQAIVARDILPEADQLSFNERQPASLLAEFGARYREYLEQSLSLQKIRNACNLAFAQCQRQLTYGKTAKTCAAYKLGAFHAEELAVEVWLRAFEEGKTALRIYASSPIPNYNHVFVILGITQEHWVALLDAHGEDLLATLKALKKGIVVDPYLNSVCAGRDFAGSETCRYLTDSGITQYEECIETPPGEDADEVHRIVTALRADADTIVEFANTILNTKANTSDGIKAIRRILIRFKIDDEAKNQAPTDASKKD